MRNRLLGLVIVLGFAMFLWGCGDNDDNGNGDGGNGQAVTWKTPTSFDGTFSSPTSGACGRIEGNLAGKYDAEVELPPCEDVCCPVCSFPGCISWCAVLEPICYVGPGILVNGHLNTDTGLLYGYGEGVEVVGTAALSGNGFTMQGAWESYDEDAGTWEASGTF